MKIALVGPITGHALHLAGADSLPVTHNFTMNSDFANALIARGHEVHVFTGGAVPMPVHLETGRHSVTVVPRAGKSSALKVYIPTMRALRRALAAQVPFDVVHAHWLYDYALAALAVEPRALVTVHDWPMKILQLDPGIPSLSRYMLSKQVIPKVRRATAPSEYMRQIAVDRLRFHDVALVANGFPKEHFSPFVERDERNNRLVAVNVGFDKRKNVAGLIEAFDRIRRDIPDARLDLIGPGYGSGEAAHRFATRRGLTEGIDFFGRVERATILDRLQAAALFVHPSIEESFGLVVIEAMSQGLAVLGGKTSGAIPWLLEEGRAGFLCDVTSPDAIATAVSQALRNRPLLNTIARNGWERAGLEFTVDTMTDRYLDLYRQAPAR